MSKFKISATLFSLFCCWANPVTAQNTDSEECSNITSSGHYQHEYTVDEFVIFYNLSGEDAISSQADDNNNSLPDIVEDTMQQLVTMRDVLHSLGFKYPLDQYRYERAGVDRIYVSMRNRNVKGLAYDPPHRDVTPGLEEPCVLLIGLSSKLEIGDLTPAHELFHLYQYGYTVFKNSWYLEGMARWAERLLGERTYQIGLIPNTPEEKEALFSQSYDANPFWMAFLNTVSPSTNGERNYSDDLLARRYVNGSQVIHEKASTHGAAAIINVLESFDTLDLQIGNDKSRRSKSWSNAARSDAANNQPMLNAAYQLMDNQ